MYKREFDLIKKAIQVRNRIKLLPKEGGFTISYTSLEGRGDELIGEIPVGIYPRVKIKLDK